ncbi:MAG: HAMP domain-containing histidine kinase [Christensenellaceae bacterium]|jgi:signal transduction histidine kinase|nr:HAMP domain-containing histidine kinase [Christensenellaceae bacterium]
MKFPRLWPLRLSFKPTIRKKIVLWLSAFFLGMLIAMNLLIARDVQSSNEEYINDDLVMLKNNGLLYVRQNLVLENLDNDEGSFAKIAVELCEEIAAATKNPTAAYTTDGRLISSTDSSLFGALRFEDLQRAKGESGVPTFTLNTEGGNTYAYFSYPIAIEGKRIGLLRVVADYSVLYWQGNNIITSVSLITLFIFALTLLFAILFTGSISRPISQLARISSEVEKEVEQSRLDISHVVRLQRSPRKDEIGQLSRNYANMILKIDQQMKTINTDKNELRRLSEYTKEFYDSVTHELKTPLTSIRGYADILEENGFTDKEFFDKGIAYIRSESDRMFQMVVRLLEMSRISGIVEMPKERLDLSELLSQVCEGMQFKADKYGSTISLRVRHRASVFANGDQLREVFINLIDNAIKYGYPNSVIDVVMSSGREAMYVAVSNQGEGVEESEIPKLFVPFYRRKDRDEAAREEGSSGLGLGICKQIVEQHGGYIEMISRRRGPTSVRVTLPAYRGI